MSERNEMSILMCINKDRDYITVNRPSVLSGTCMYHVHIMVCRNIYLKLASVAALRRRPPTQFYSPSTTVETHYTPAADVVTSDSMSCRDRTAEFQSVIQSLQVRTCETERVYGL